MLDALLDFIDSLRINKPLIEFEFRFIDKHDMIRTGRRSAKSMKDIINKIIHDGDHPIDVHEYVKIREEVKEVPDIPKRRKYVRKTKKVSS